MYSMTSKAYLTSADMLVIEEILADAGIGVLHKERSVYCRLLVRLVETGTTDPADLSVVLLRRLGDSRFNACWRVATPLHRHAVQGMPRR